MLQRVSSKAKHPELVGERTNGAEKRLHDVLRPAKGITHPMKAPGVANDRAGMEELQTQRRIIQSLSSFRIPGKEDLEPAIKLESLHTISPDSPAHIVRALKDRARDTRLRQTTRTGKPCQTSADDQHSMGGSHHHVIVVGRMRKWNHAILASTARCFSLLTAERRAQAVNLDTVVEQVCHAGRKRWTMRREKTPDPFSSFQHILCWIKNFSTSLAPERSCLPGGISL
jgi:hypothetical protein